MTTLLQIRKNKKQNSILHEELNNNYNNSTSLSIIVKLIKTENIKIINEISKEKGINNCERQLLINKFIKPNYYTPYVVNSEIKENLQQLI